MPKTTIPSYPFPANTPSESNFSYLCYGYAGESTYSGYRDWVGGAWVLNELENVEYFLEVGKKAIG